MYPGFQGFMGGQSDFGEYSFPEHRYYDQKVVFDLEVNNTITSASQFNQFLNKNWEPHKLRNMAAGFSPLVISLVRKTY